VTTKADSWKKKSGLISKEYRNGIDKIEQARNDKCPNCNASVSEGDEVCWVCKRILMEA
jgi:hypothetical protein